METKPKFPDHRLTDLKRQAELAIYRSIQASALPGMAVYGQRPGPSGPELDFAIWLQNVARMTLEVKGRGLHHRGLSMVPRRAGWEQSQAEPALPGLGTAPWR